MNKITARVSAETHSVWHASVNVSTPTLVREGVCSDHPLNSAEPTEGTAPCWRCGEEAPASYMPASQSRYLRCEHNHRTPEAAEDCGRALARQHGAKVC